jgi:type VI secretion system protein ImpB
VLVVGDFTLQKDERAIEDRKPINIDKDNFNDVLDAQKLRLETVVQNKLSDEPDAQMGISLDFKNIKDFEPDAIVQKIPELKKLMDLREALKALKGPLGNIPEFRKKVQELVQDESVRDRLLKELGIEG